MFSTNYHVELLYYMHLMVNRIIKTVSFGNKTFYKPGMQGNTAVQLRAARIGGEYQRTATKVDQELGFADGGGPTLRKLQSFPPVLDLVFGAYGECSDGVKSMLDSFGDSRLRTQGLAKGTRGPEGARTGDWLSAPPPLHSSDSGKCAMPAGADALGW